MKFELFWSLHKSILSLVSNILLSNIFNGHRHGNLINEKKFLYQFCLEEKTFTILELFHFKSIIYSSFFCFS